jgi:hypothetical protein
MVNIQSRKINSQSLENQFNQLTCLYRNESEFMQIVRISPTKSQPAFFERTVLPNQCIQFSAAADALLEIYESSAFSTIHADTIPCDRLVVSSMDKARDIVSITPSYREQVLAA